MRRAVVGSLIMMLALAACEDDIVYVDDPDVPAAPRALAASYYAGSVTVTWELAPAWNGEAFRVYSRRDTDADWFFIAEVTSCTDGFCTYEDLNLVAGETYEYLVSAVNDAGVETESDFSVEVFVPQPIAPPVPDASFVVALDDANYLVWGTESRSAGDFSHYKVYLDDGSTSFLLGETDSEGFIDLLAVNGNPYAYFVTAVDADGHESEGSAVIEGTPRPDFTGELVYDFFDAPASSGFRFQEDETVLPIVDGTDPDRHFRFEVDVSGWWIVPGPGSAAYATPFATTALTCGVGADADCVDVPSAPLTGYVTTDRSILAQESWVLRVIGDDGQAHYGVIRVAHVGVDQDGNDFMIFDWAYQLQANNPNLHPGSGLEGTIGG